MDHHSLRSRTTNNERKPASSAQLLPYQHNKQNSLLLDEEEKQTNLLLNKLNLLTAKLESAEASTNINNKHLNNNNCNYKSQPNNFSLISNKNSTNTPQTTTNTRMQSITKQSNKYEDNNTDNNGNYDDEEEDYFCNSRQNQFEDFDDETFSFNANNNSNNNKNNEKERLQAHQHKNFIITDTSKQTNRKILANNNQKSIDLDDIEVHDDYDDEDEEEGNDDPNMNYTNTNENDEDDKLKNDDDEANNRNKVLFPGYVPIALKYFSQSSMPRFWCLRMITSPWFEKVSMLAILINCITLGMYQPCNDNPCSSTRCVVLQYLDHGIFLFFAIEMSIKIMAMGFIGKDTYMAEAWNRLDFFIVAAGTFEYSIATENLSLSAIRTVRVLRPLRAINRVPSMRILVMLLLDTLPMLGNVLLLCFFVFFIFGIVGVQLWKGVLRNRCFFDYNRTLMGDLLDESFQSNYYRPEFSDSFICTDSVTGGGMTTCADIPPYINNSRICNGTIDLLRRSDYNLINSPAYYRNESLNSIDSSSGYIVSTTCVNWNFYYSKCRPSDKNPFKGAISFDNIGYAWVAIFQIISLESWVTIMYYIQDAHSFYNWIYFVFLIVIGSFFMINLCLVVIATQFSETKKRETERMIAERRRFSRSSSTLLSDSAGEPGSCWEELIKYLVHFVRRSKRRLLRKYSQWKSNRQNIRMQEMQKNREIVIIREETEEDDLLLLHNINNNDQNNLAQKSILCNNKDHFWHQEFQNELKQELFKYVGKNEIIISSSTKCSNPLHSKYDYYFGGFKFINNNVTSTATNESIIPNDLEGKPINKAVEETTSFSSSPQTPINTFVTINLNDNMASNDSSMLSECKFCQIITSLKEKKQNSTSNHQDHQEACIENDENNNQKADFYFYCYFKSVNSLELNDLNEQQLNNKLRNKYLVETIKFDLNNPAGDLTSINSSVNRTNEINKKKILVNKTPNKTTTSLSSSSSSTFCCCISTNGSFCRAITTSRCWRCLTIMQKHLKKFVDGKIFQRGILFAILINTLSMGIEHHEQPPVLTAVVEYSNFFFTCVFFFEMVLKILADGAFEYIKNAYNLFDGIIVGISAYEVLKQFTSSPEDHISAPSGVSVLRTFRLLRILKLVRFMPALRRQLVVMLKTIDNVATFFSLLILFIFIFSILGMNLFGCKFCVKLSNNTRVCERKNFDSLLWAIITVFQVLTQEDWNEVLYNGMDKTSPWAALYFIALMTFGNYVLFNLLVAILVEGFSTEDEPKKIEDRIREDAIHAIQAEELSRQENESSNRQDGASSKLSASLNDGTSSILKRSKSIMKRTPSTKCRDENNSGTGSNRQSMKSASSHNSSAKRKSIKSKQFVQESSNDKEESFGKSINNLHASKHSVNFCSSVTNIPSVTLNGKLSSKPNDQTKYKHSSTRNLSYQSNTNNNNNNNKNNNTNNNLCIQLPIITHTCATPNITPSSSSINLHNFKLNHHARLVNQRFNRKFSLDSANDRIFRKSKSLSKLFIKPSNNQKIHDKKSSLFLLLSSQQIYQHQTNELDNSCKVANTKAISSPLPKILISDTTSLTSNNEAQLETTIVRDENENGTELPLIDSLKQRNSRNFFLPVNQYKSKSLALPTKTFTSRKNLRSKSEKHRSSSSHSVKKNSAISLEENKTDREALNDIPLVLEAQNTKTSLENCISNNIEQTKISNKTEDESMKKNNLTSSKSTKKQSTRSNKTQSSANANKKSVRNKKNDENKKKQAAKTKEEEEEDELIDLNCCSKMPKPTGCFITRKEYSLYIFSKQNKIRKICNHVASQKWFDYSILFLIAMNCITLAMERPNIPPNSFERKFLVNTNYFFTFAFAIEMCVKVIDAGFYAGEGAYLSSGWNVMDCFLVVISTVDAIITLTARSSPKIFGILRVFRLLRTLRPLRVISRAPGLKLVVQTLLSSLRPIGNIVLICCTFFIIFGILGVQLFKGKLFHCIGDVKDVKTKDDCLANPNNQWVNSQYNFDNLGKALMALFVLSSKDGWVQIMYTGIDAVGVDKQPIENYNEWMLLYFISFLLLVGFFVLNMFVGVIIENFHKCRAEQEREEKARRAAKRAKKFEEKRQKMKEIPYYAHYSRMRRLLHDVCNSKYFDLIIAGVIGINVVSMSLEFYLMPPELGEILDIFNLVFTFIFLIEAVLRMIALGVVRYFKEKWNQLDIIIVILSIVGIIFDKLETKSVIPVNPTIIRVMRVLRIARVLKLLKMAKGIRSLLDTVIQALPQVGNLGLLFFLLFFIFAILGVELFGKLNCESVRSACDGLSKHAHFHNFGMAILTLFRIATGDNWNGIMKDTLKDNVLCYDETLPPDVPQSKWCLASILAPIYFVIFVLMAQFVLVNVVVAVLMNNLDDSNKMQADEAEMDEEIEKQLAEEVRNELCNEDKLNMEDYLENESFIHFNKQSSLPPNFTFNDIENDQESEYASKKHSIGNKLIETIKEGNNEKFFLIGNNLKGMNDSYFGSNKLNEINSSTTASNNYFEPSYDSTTPSNCQNLETMPNVPNETISLLTEKLAKIQSNSSNFSQNDTDETRNKDKMSKTNTSNNANKKKPRRIKDKLYDYEYEDEDEFENYDEDENYDDEDDDDSSRVIVNEKIFLKNANKISLSSSSSVNNNLYASSIINNNNNNSNNTTNATANKGTNRSKDDDSKGDDNDES